MVAGDRRQRRAGLRPSGLNALPVVVHESGWDFRVFEVAERWIVRIPRSDEHALRMQRELELLPDVAERVECRVPSVLATGRVGERPFMLYERIPGRPMRSGDDLEALGRFLAGLWSTPPRPGMPSAAAERQAFLAAVESDVLPVLPSALRSRVERDLVPDPTDDDTVVIHHDLGPGHVLFDDSGRLSGVIDFTDAAVGNPNGDLVGVLIAAGEDAVDVVARAAGVEPDWDRLRRYWRCGPLHEVLHGLRTGDPSFVASGVEGALVRYGG